MEKAVPHLRMRTRMAPLEQIVCASGRFMLGNRIKKNTHFKESREARPPHINYIDVEQKKLKRT